MNEEKLKFGIDITNDKLFQFYAGTGKIMGFENKGVFIRFGTNDAKKDCPFGCANVRK